MNDLPNVCPNVNIQMYADDAVFVPQANYIQEAPFSLTSAFIHVQNGLLKRIYYRMLKKSVYEI